MFEYFNFMDRLRYTVFSIIAGLAAPSSDSVAAVTNLSAEIQKCFDFEVGGRGEVVSVAERIEAASQ
jgi:hypothetical protein